MMEEDRQPPLGSAIDEEQTNVQIGNGVVVLADTCSQEVLEVDRVVLREASIWQGHGVIDQRREELLEMVVHPSLGQPTDEV